MRITAVEHDAYVAGHPRFASPAGDRRERPVACTRCGQPTLALRPRICVVCDPISDGIPPAVGEAPGSATPARRPGAAPSPEDRVVDLMAALEESIERAKQDRQKNAPAAADDGSGA